jgi:hypothetical protein
MTDIGELTEMTICYLHLESGMTEGAWQPIGCALPSITQFTRLFIMPNHKCLGSDTIYAVGIELEGMEYIDSNMGVGFVVTKSMGNNSLLFFMGLALRAAQSWAGAVAIGPACEPEPHYWLRHLS